MSKYSTSVARTGSQMTIYEDGADDHGVSIQVPNIKFTRANLSNLQIKGKQLRQFYGLYAKKAQKVQSIFI